MNKKIIGLTGMSGAGKSTASEFLKTHGFCVIDCDKVANETIARSPCTDRVRVAFPEIITDGKFDRKKAAEVLFTSPIKLEQYQKIVFPYVIYSVIRFIKTSSSEKVLLDAPTLFQSGADDLCDEIIAVVAARKTCVERIMKRDCISKRAALMRLDNQPNEMFFRENAVHVIENNESKDALAEKIRGII
ncbi:MAG: dephospho-CoA kinase [Oscillospiraceae bacterium]|nr:dephospho-CoA kinase [Oscillospiraceae bacterium]